MQGLLLLRALRSIYVALGSFAAATLVTLVAAVIEQVHFFTWYRTLTSIGLAAGALGVANLILGSLKLFRATRLSLASISEEASIIRKRHAARDALGASAGQKPPATAPVEASDETL
jgi:hypothetical protein